MRNVLGILLGCCAAVAILAWLAERSQFTPKIQETLVQIQSQAAPAIESAVKTLQNAPLPEPEPEAKPVLTGGAPQAGGVVRISAIRDDRNYGWIQLPRGVQVHLIETRPDGYLVRYEDSYAVLPKAAVDEGAVVLKTPRATVAF